MPVLTTLITVLVGAGVALLFYGLSKRLGAAVDVVEQRLGRYIDAVPEAAQPVERRGGKLTDTVNTIVDRQHFAERLRTQLSQANLRMTPGEFVMLRLGAGALALLLGYKILGGVLPGLGLALVGYVLPRFWLKRRLKQRRRKFMDLLGDAILMMSSSLRAGYSMMQALELISRETPEPICDEFHRVTMEVGVGIPIEDALRHLAERVDSPDLELMISAMNIQREVGGNLAEILDIIAATIRERQELQGELRALTAQGRISSYIITGLPVFVGAAMYFMNRPYISTLWTTTFGYFLSGVCVVMVVLGFFATRKVAQVEV